MTHESSQPIIQLSNVHFTYDNGEHWPLDGVDLQIHAGERIALVGSNGSGKSTLARIIAGLVAPDTGIVDLVGQRVFDQDGAHAQAYRDARRSLGIVFQNPEDQMVTTVTQEDVAFGPENLGVAPAHIGERVFGALDAVDMRAFAAADPTVMSGGQQQRIAIADMLAMDSKVLVLDEPTAMLDPQARAEVMRVLDIVQQRGTSIVLVTHHAREQLHADRILELRDGVLHDVTSAQEAALSHSAVKDDIELPTLPLVHTQCDHPIIQLSHVSFTYTGSNHPVLHDVNVSIEQGSTVALLGPNGSGKTTFIKLLCALRTPTEGTIRVDGIALRHAHRRERAALRRTLGLIMQHPEQQLFAQTVYDDVAFGPRNLGFNEQEVQQRVQDALDVVGLRECADANPFTLSGGQQRLAAIAGVLACNPRIVVMDEPTASLDNQACARIDSVIQHLHEQGVTIVLITHDMNMAQRLADHMLVLSNTASPQYEYAPQESEQQETPVHTPSPADPNYSWVSSLDPRIKCPAFLVLMFSSFAMSSWLQLGLGIACACALTVLSRIPLRDLWRSVRLFLGMFLVMGLFNMFIVHEGTVLAHIGPWELTSGAITIAVLYTLRFSLVIIFGAIAITTTSPTALTDAFAGLLKPLHRWIHDQELALVLSLALRFLPTLTREALAIRDAQAARGGSIETGNIVQRVRAMIAIIVPIFAATIRHADNLALALDARCYQEGIQRTRWHALTIHARDWVFLIGVCVVTASVFCAPLLTI